MNASGRPLRLGVIGAGSHASENLLPAVRLSEQFHLDVICTRSESTASAAAKRWQAQGWTTSIDQVLERSDAVVVSGPPDLHEQVIKEATNCGVPLFVEKPPAMSTQRLLAALAVPLAEAAVFVDFNMRFSTMYQRAVEEVPCEAPQMMRIRMIARKPSVPLWGSADIIESSLLAVGIHGIDMLTNRFGPPADLTVRCVMLDDVRFSLLVSASFPGQRLGVLELGNYSNTFESSVEVIAATGSSRLDNLTTLTRRPIGNSTTDKYARSLEIGGLTGGFERNGYSMALGAFAAMAHGDAPNNSDLVGAMHALDVVQLVLDQVPRRK